MEPAEEGPPLLPLGPGLMELDGAKKAPEDGAAVEEAQTRRLTPHFSHPERDNCELAHYCYRGLVSCLAGMYRVGGLAPWCKTDRTDSPWKLACILILTCLAPGPKEPLRLGPVACPALKAT